MSIETKYKCDKCGKESDVCSDFWSVGISWSNGAQKIYKYSTREVQKTKDFCRECTEKMGLLPFMELKEKPIEQEKASRVTIEDIIREIIQEQTGAC